jgi:isopentenyl-diphosphate Delta-isomerase
MSVNETQTNVQTMVILVDEQDNELGVMDKLQAHRQPTLHRAFSVFIFNSNQEMLLQQRAAGKYHSAGLWTNACCSHPLPGETTAAAAQRRLFEEMGFNTPLEKAFDFTYQACFDNGLSEYEYDHVFAGRYDGPVHPNPEEAGNYCYMPVSEIKEWLQRRPGQFTVWFHLAFPRICNWLQP